MNRLVINSRRALVALVALFSGFILCAVPRAFATELSVIDATLRSDAPSAEFCATFNAPVAFPSREALAASIVLKKDGKRQKVEPKALSLTETELCVQELERRAVYLVSLPELKNKNGQRFEKNKPFAFTLADRKPALGFVGRAVLSSFPSYSDAASGFVPVLRSVNVQETRLTLYKLDKRETFALALQKFAQSALAQSESLTYARENGKVVFESDLVFAGKPNQPQIMPAPLPARQTLASGLYYLAAVPKEDAAQDPGLLAGQWFVVSNIRLAARREAKGAKAFVSSVQNDKGLAQASVFLSNDKGDILAEGKTDQEGTIFVPLRDEDAKGALYACAQDSYGNMDISLLSDAPQGEESKTAFLSTDRGAYKSGESLFAFLGAEPSVFGEEKERGVLRLSRPDGGVYTEYPVPWFKDVLAVPLDFPYTHSYGVWRLSWHGPDGASLGETNVRSLHADGRAVMEVEPARKRIGADGKLELFVRTNASFRKGKAVVRPVRPEQTAWHGYVFGSPIDESPTALAEETFMTGRDGNGSVELNFDLKNSPVVLEAFEIVVSLEGEAEKKRLVLAPREAPPLVGVKPLPREAFLPGSQQAAFSVVALDSQGKRVAQHDLHFTIFEEGRSFSWAPLEEGYWSAKPLPHRRRVGGGALSVPANEEGAIVWSVTPGRYSLEIADQTGRILARHAFDGKQEGVSDDKEARLPKMESAARPFEIAPLDPKKTYIGGKKISFPVRVKGLKSGARSAVIVAVRFVPDDARALAPKPYVAYATLDAKGLAQVPLELASSFDGTAHVVTTVWSDGKSVDQFSAFFVRPAFSVLAPVPEVLDVGDVADVRVVVRLNEGTEGTYLCAAESSGALAPKDNRQLRVRLKKGEQKTLGFSFVARASGHGSATFSCMTTTAMTTTVARLTRSVFVPGNAQKRKEEAVFELKSDEPLALEPRDVLAAPLMPAGLMSALGAFMGELPLTTIDISRWIEASLLWEKSLVSLDFARVEEIESLRARRKAQLALRQKNEGCMTVFDGEGPCDLASTAQAMRTLRSGPVWASASGWLKRKLQNTWIDEGERDSRALAFEALAQAGAADSSALRYFAQTSEDKNLSPRAQAALSLALAVGAKDDSLSRQWAERARNGKEALSLEVLALLAENDNVSLNVLTDLMLKGGFSSPTASEKDLASWLVVFARAALKVKPWKVRINGEEKTVEGVFAARAQDSVTRIENISGRALFFCQESTEEKKEKKKEQLRFALYTLDGSSVLADDALEIGRPYLMRMDVDAPMLPSFLIFPKRAAFDLVPLDSVMRFYPWLGGSFARATSIAQTSWGYAVRLQDAPAGSSAWRVAAILTPRQRGKFSLPAPVWKDEAGQEPSPISFFSSQKTVY